MKVKLKINLKVKENNIVKANVYVNFKTEVKVISKSDKGYGQGQGHMLEQRQGQGQDQWLLVSVQTKGHHLTYLTYLHHQ